MYLLLLKIFFSICLWGTVSGPFISPWSLPWAGLSGNKFPQLLFIWEHLNFSLTFEGQFCSVEDFWLTFWSEHLEYTGPLTSCLWLFWSIFDLQHYNVMVRYFCELQNDHYNKSSYCLCHTKIGYYWLYSPQHTFHPYDSFVLKLEVCTLISLTPFTHPTLPPLWQICFYCYFCDSILFCSFCSICSSVF